MWGLIVSWALLAVAFYLTALIVPGIHVVGGVFAFLFIALVFGLVNGILGPILKIATLPIRIMTLGLFSLVINAVLLLLVAAIAPSALKIDNFLWAVVAALVLAIVSMVLNTVIGTVLKRAVK
jgi:putative membrane protein